MKKKEMKIVALALASFLMLVCIVAASPDSTLRFIDPTPANYTQEQDFSLGVLAINTHRSIYLPDETAFIGIAVLDNEGHMACDADVTLTITDPSDNETVLSTGNGLINVSPQCCVYGVTNLPDFYTNYTVDGAGTYVMNLTAITADGTKSITDEFTVQSSVDFDVARDGATRIYPPVPYVMNFTIEANKDYDGLIREYVPASFVITPQEGLTVTTAGDTKILTWNKKLVKGENHNIYYEFDAPDVSPYLFTLGALEIGSFKEDRQWQIASDAPTVGTVTTSACECNIDTHPHAQAAAGFNRLLVVGVGLGTGLDTEEVLSITYSGTSLTFLATAEVTGNKVRVEAWYLVNPSTTGDNKVVVTLKGGNAQKIAIGAISFTGVDQTTPIDTGTVQTTQGKGTSGSVTVASEIDDLVMSVIGAENTIAAGDTEQWDVEMGAPGASSKYGGGSTAAGATSVVMDWTIGGNNNYAIVGFNINAVTWESYSDSGHTTVCNDFASPQHTVYMFGEGFRPSTAYRIIYWAGTGVNRKTDDKSSDANGDLSSSHTFVAGTDEAGTWYASVYPEGYSTGSHNPDDPNLVADDTFEVQQSAIPEFSTVLTAIAVCMLCAISYMVMRRKVGKR